MTLRMVTRVTSINTSGLPSQPVFPLNDHQRFIKPLRVLGIGNDCRCFPLPIGVGALRGNAGLMLVQVGKS
jgi:hypothetical protein